MKICLDSNVFIAIHNQEQNQLAAEKIIEAIERHQHEGIISMSVMTELMVGYYQIGEIQEMHTFLAKSKLLFNLVPVSLEISQEAAELRAFYSIKLPDALILATAKLLNADILISNDIEMKKKSYLKILTIEDFVKNYVENG